MSEARRNIEHLIVAALRNSEQAHKGLMIGELRGSVAKRAAGLILARYRLVLKEGVDDGEVLFEGAPEETVEGGGSETQAPRPETEGAV